MLLGVFRGRLGGEEDGFPISNVTVSPFSSLQCLNWSTKGECPQPWPGCCPKLLELVKLSEAMLGSAMRAREGWVSVLLLMRVSTFQACDGSAHPQTAL